MCWWVPKVWWFAERTQHIIVLKAPICHSERIWSKISKGKSTWGAVQGKLGTSFQGPSLRESHRICLIRPTNVTTPVKCCQPRKLIKDSAPRDGHPVMYQNSRLPEEKRVCSINHICCTVSGTVIHSYELMGNLQKSTVPDASQGPSLKAGYWGLPCGIFSARGIMPQVLKALTVWQVLFFIYFILTTTISQMKNWGT